MRLFLTMVSLISKCPPAGGTAIVENVKKTKIRSCCLQVSGARELYWFEGEPLNWSELSCDEFLTGRQGTLMHILTCTHTFTLILSCSKSHHQTCHWPWQQDIKWRRRMGIALLYVERRKKTPFKKKYARSFLKHWCVQLDNL